MATRQLIAWGIILFLVLMIGAGIRIAATTERRQRARERRALDRRANARATEDRR